MTKHDIQTIERLDEIDQASFQRPQIIYKHSTTCELNQMIWNQLQQSDLELQYLDLLTYRPISNAIEARYQVRHESPQILIIKEGKCVYHVSHRKIKNEEIRAFLDSLNA
ncbi:bacillithiol system redox-active protein YtxJ [Faecalibacter sp. LW9]|uniref:bacillithiol system redox-active protein YtxJ n=1 Tax=Faecalibacter sp. LW9 TaxID=3103144 RepID=UPI002AFEA62C|nr:bacillithiol system redox-active protein YtxJ [Faecalibacter sp. LW9]